MAVGAPPPPLGFMDVLPKSVPPSATYTQMEHEQIEGTVSINTTAKVTHLKNEVVVVCFLTSETPGEPWATAKLSQHISKLHDTRKGHKRHKRQNMQHHPAQNLYPPGLTERLAEIYTPGYTFFWGASHPMHASLRKLGIQHSTLSNSPSIHSQSVLLTKKTTRSKYRDPKLMCMSV